MTRHINWRRRIERQKKVRQERQERRRQEAKATDFAKMSFEELQDTADNGDVAFRTEAQAELKRRRKIAKAELSTKSLDELRSLLPSDSNPSDLVQSTLDAKAKAESERRPRRVWKKKKKSRHSPGPVREPTDWWREQD